MAAIQKRRHELRSELSQIEKQIYDLETSYLEETKDIGNIFTGWNVYLSKEKVKIRKQILGEDRLFSLSSITSPASRREEAKKTASNKASSSGTPSAKGRGKKRKDTEAEAEAVTEVLEVVEVVD